MRPAKKQQTSQTTTDRDIAIGGTAGAGLGTCVVFLAKAFLPNNSPEQAILIYLAPSISLGISAIVLWIFRKVKIGFALTELKRQVKQARLELQEIRHNLSCDGSTNLDLSKHINELETYVQDLEKTYFEALRERAIETAREVSQK
jgi:hypothetical protein